MLQQEFEWNEEIWSLPPVELKNGDKMKFGEVIDSKQIVKNKMDMGENFIECLQPLSAIFFRKKGEQYTEQLLYEGSERMKLLETLPMNLAMQVSVFFSEHSKYLADHFPIFWPAKVKQTGQNAKKHFDRWGWVNLLKSIAATKVFDLPGVGMNSIDCTRQSPAFDVLIFASEEKELVEAQSLDHEIEMQKHK